MNKVVVLWFMTLSTLLSFSNSSGVLCGNAVEMQPLMGPCPIGWEMNSGGALMQCQQTEQLK